MANSLAKAIKSGELNARGTGGDALGEGRSGRISSSESRMVMKGLALRLVRGYQA